MRKISMTTSQFMRYGDEADGFAKMRALGFDACDYSPLTQPGRGLLGLSEDERLRVLTKARENAEAAGVEIYQAHGPWVGAVTPFNSTPEGRREWADAMRTDLDCCAILGCPHLVVHPVMPFGGASTSDEEGYLRINREFWSDVLEHAEKTGVKLLLENMPFLQQSLSTCKAMIEFVRSFKTDAFAMCYDTGHALVFGENIADNIALIGDKLLAFHVHDNDGRRDLHMCPYFGVADWNAFREAIKSVPESVPLSLESGAGKVPAHLQEDFLRGFAKVARELA